MRAPELFSVQPPDQVLSKTTSSTVNEKSSGNSDFKRALDDQRKTIDQSQKTANQPSPETDKKQAQNVDNDLSEDDVTKVVGQEPADNNAVRSVSPAEEHRDDFTLNDTVPAEEIDSSVSIVPAPVIAVPETSGESDIVHVVPIISEPITRVSQLQHRQLNAASINGIRALALDEHAGEEPRLIESLNASDSGARNTLFSATLVPPPNLPELTVTAREGSTFATLTSTSQEALTTQQLLQPVIRPISSQNVLDTSFDLDLVQEGLDLTSLDIKSSDQKTASSSLVGTFNTVTGTNTPSTALSGNTARFTVNVQFGRAEWHADVASKVAQMAAKNLNFAEIQLDPPELGPLQVRVQVNQDQASVVFTASTAQVREALEQGNARLKEMLEGEGVNLVDVDVRDQEQKSTEDDTELHFMGRDGGLAEDDTSEPPNTVLSSAINMGVDDYV